MPPPTIRPVYKTGDNQMSEMREARTRSGRSSFPVTPESSVAPTARLSSSRPTYPEASLSYQAMRSASNEEVVRDGYGSPSLLGSSASSSSTAPHISSRLSSSETPPVHSSARFSEEDNSRGVRKLFAPWQKTFAAPSNAGPASLRPNPSMDVTENDRSIDISRDSMANSLASSRRGSFANGVRYSEAARAHPQSTQNYSRLMQDYEFDSNPETPLPRPTPPWMHNSRSGRSSSPVASSLYLPGTGIGSPGGESMQSMASSPHVSILTFVIFGVL